MTNQDGGLPQVSKEYPHNHIQLARSQAVSINGEGSQSPELCRKKKVGAGSVDEIGKLAAIAGYVGREISRRQARTESADIAGVSTILAGSRVELELWRRLVLELGPSAGRA